MLLDGLPVPPDEYAQRLVLGVDEHHEEIDTIIAKFSEHWSLERMPVVDRALLRIGTYELGWLPEVPDRGRDHRGGRAREAVLHQGLRSVRERAALAHRRRSPPRGVSRLGRRDRDRGDRRSRHGRGAARRHRHPTRRTVGRDRLGRSDQPDGLRHLRVPEALRVLQAKARRLMLQVHNEGQGRRGERQPGTVRERRRAAARARALGHDAARQVT